MTLRLWNYLKGYVIIEVRGFSVERFVNLAVNKGIYIWDIETRGGAVRMSVSIKGFRNLRQCARKTKCKYRIIEKRGWPFTTYRYRKRKLYAGGTVVFVALLYFLSSFVWHIEVVGNSRIETSQILSFCEGHGLKNGAFKRNINKKALEAEMLRNFSEISFLNIGIKGTKAEITLSETLPEKSIVDREAPCDIIAKKDGLIFSVVAASGTPAAKVKDVVQKGDLLISGRLLIGPEGSMEQYVHASGEVTAKLFYEINFAVPRVYVEKRYTGEKKSVYRFNVLGRDINILKASIPYGSYDKITEKTILRVGESFPLPVVIIKDTYSEFVPVEHERDLTQMLEIGAIIVNNRVVREYGVESEVIDKKTEYYETDMGIKIKALITTVENIGEAVPINLEAGPLGN